MAILFSSKGTQVKKDGIEKTAAEMQKLWDTFMANAPATNYGDEFNMRDFVDDDAAMMLAQFLHEEGRKHKRRSVKSHFYNGILYGIMLAELGLGKYIFREKSGELPPEPEKKQRPIILGDMSGKANGE
jgi:hypothetical protein